MLYQTSILIIRGIESKHISVQNFLSTIHVSDNQLGNSHIGGITTHKIVAAVPIPTTTMHILHRTCSLEMTTAPYIIYIIGYHPQ